MHPFRPSLIAAAMSLAVVTTAATATATATAITATSQNPLSQDPMRLAGNPLPHHPLLSDDGRTPSPSAATAISSNWSGYAATATPTKPAFTSVSTTFIQPSITCSSGDQYVSFWVGLDGFNSNTVEQTGTEATCIGRTPEYSAWYELYPAAAVTYDRTVRPGDKITEVVSFSGTSTYTLTIVDSTRHWSQTTTRTFSGGRRSSAEVVTEAPAGSASVPPLADFGRLTFTNVTVDGTSLARLNPTAITMVSGSGVPLATVSALTGSSFQDMWQEQ